MNCPEFPDGWTGCITGGLFISGGPMISTGNYIFGWLVIGVLMGLGFIAGGSDGRMGN